MLDPDKPCPHENFDANVEVTRITGDDEAMVIGYSADIRVWCHECHEPFLWNGLDVGLSPRKPMSSLDQQELRAPLRPQSGEPDAGFGLPGFTMAMHHPDPADSHTSNKPDTGGPSD